MPLVKTRKNAQNERSKMMTLNTKKLEKNILKVLY